MVAIVTTSATAEREENSSVRSTAVPITTKPIIEPTVVSAHTACSKIPSSGATKYAKKPAIQRKPSIASTIRASRCVVRR